MSRPFKPGPTAVYRHINAAGETLYIGCSYNPALRFLSHRSSSPWAAEVTRIEMQWFGNPQDALAEEARLISLEQPPMNLKLCKEPRAHSSPAITAGKSAHQLALYLAKTGETQRAFAGRAGISATFVCDILKGRRSPQAKTIKLIDKATDGFVPPSAWFEEPLHTHT